MFSKVLSADVRGMEGCLVRVEADISEGMPQFLMVGYLSSEVKEAGDRVRTALRNTGIRLPSGRITVNLAPACLRKAGSRFDLPVAAAILGAMGEIPAENLQNLMLVGELSLNGQLLPVRGVMALVEAAREQGITRCVVPGENAAEGAVLTGMDVIGVSSLTEFVKLMRCPEKAEPVRVDTERLLKAEAEKERADFSQISGQAAVRRAAEVAAAGMHNLLMIGPPGAGKTMIAGRIPGILPSLSLEESLEVSKVYSIAGLLPAEQPLMARRPFRSPHHTATPRALTGGGRIPSPGEISLSTHGILFMDELPEFGRNTLEVLRQPLEERKVVISRAAGTYEFPAEFMLVAAMNPCPCGYYPDRDRCRCSERETAKYLGRVSRPLLDRIDICTEVSRLSYEDLSEPRPGESSAAIRERVKAAHAVQRERYQGKDFRFNAHLDAGELERFCLMGAQEKELLREAFTKLNLSARSYHKMIRVARTIADLDGAEAIGEGHILEAVSYRTPDTKYWMRQEE